MSKKILHATDVSFVKIEPIYKNDFLDDIVVTFPKGKGYREEPISFNDIGLINFRPDITYTEDECRVPIVTLSFYGRLVCDNSDIEYEERKE